VHETASVLVIAVGMMYSNCNCDERLMLMPYATPPYGLYTISVVIPARNEAPNLPHVLPRIPKWVTEVILVDGNSVDDTIATARAIMPDIRIVHQEGRGKGAALRTGFRAARGNIIVMLDADGSTNPEEIPLFVGALLAGADFAKGSRFLQGGGTSDMTFIRKMGNLGLTWSVRLLFGGEYTDLCYGYNAFWARVLPRLALDGDGFEIETEMNIRALDAKLKIYEVPSFESPRIHGLSNLRALPDGWRVLKTIVRERVRSGVVAEPQIQRSYSTPIMHGPDLNMPIPPAPAMEAQPAVLLERAVGE
jgi:glycosyltransferase involved in cell wall biosynthesis